MPYLPRSVSWLSHKTALKADAATNPCPLTNRIVEWLLPFDSLSISQCFKGYFVGIFYNESNTNNAFNPQSNLVIKINDLNID
jgi:hypothetical protein